MNKERNDILILIIETVMDGASNEELMEFDKKLTEINKEIENLNNKFKEENDIWGK